MKTVLTGAGIAAAAGLLMGAAIKPDLRNDDRPEGPQIQAGWPGARAQGPFDDGMTFASYQGEVPEYVLGTDWKKAMAPPAPAPGPPEPPAYDPPTEPAAAFTRARYEEPPRAEPVYPSIAGGADILPPPRAEEADDAAG